MSEIEVSVGLVSLKASALGFLMAAFSPCLTWSSLYMSAILD